MTLSDIKKELNKKAHHKLWLISGDNAYLKDEALNMLLKAFNSDELNTERMDEKAQENQLLLALETLPFFGAHRIVMAQDYAGFKQGEDANKALIETMQAMPKHAVLIFFSHEKVDKRKVLFKAVKKYGFVAEFSDVTANEKAIWVKQQFAEWGKKVTASQVDAIINQCGGDLLTLKNEVEKLCVLANEDVINDKDIRLVVSKSLEYNVFSLHDLLLRKKTSEALLLLKEIFETEKSPFGVMGLLASKFRTLYKARTLADLNYPQEKAIKLVGGHPYAAKMALKECRNFSAEKLRANIEQLGDLDYQIKSGQVNPNLAVEKALLSMYGAL
jgi:DNA polymerase-3 subunit delta